MKQIIKKRFKLHKFSVIIALIGLYLLISYQKVYADELNKNPYLIKINRVHNTITVYEKGDNGKYSMPVKAMICSVGKKGTETVLGSFQTKAKYRWKALMGNVWGQYSTRVVGGILFHSVYYYKYGNPASLATSEYNRLGSAASHGCIRLTVEDAKWIYDNCPVGTTVMIYDDKKSPGPLGKPASIKLPSAVKWDPTDPSEKNPYAEMLPSISGLKNKTISWGEEIDLLTGVKAKSTVGLDITPQLIIDGQVNSFRSGDYKITYSIKDALSRTRKKTITVTVDKSTQKPIFKGIKDRVVKEDTIIDNTFALSGVKVYCSDIKLNKSDIDITIEMISEEEYLITYHINVGRNVSTTEYATFCIDREAPIFSGVSDKILQPGQIPDRDFALSELSVADNYTPLGLNDIVVLIEENTDGNFLITYQVVDENGNEALESAVFHY